jgi:hypothetical protein
MHNIEKKVSFYKLSKCLSSNEAFFEKCNGFHKKQIIKLPYLFIKNVFPKISSLTILKRNLKK